MIAHYLKTKKPKSKLVILDPKKAFSKQPVFTEAFDKYYKDIIELNLTTEIDDFAVVQRRSQDQGDRHQGRQEGEGRRRQHHPAAAGRRDRRQGGLHRGRLVPDQSRQLRRQEGEGRLRAGRCLDRRRKCRSRRSRPTARPRWWRPTSWPSLPRRRGSRPATATPAGRCWRPTTTSRSAPTTRPRTASSIPPAAFVSQRGEAADVRKQNYQESVGWYAAITADMFAKPEPAPAATERDGLREQARISAGLVHFDPWAGVWAASRSRRRARSVGSSSREPATDTMTGLVRAPVLVEPERCERSARCPSR